MPKNTSFSLKNRKNRPALGTLPPGPLCLQRLRTTPPDPHINPILLPNPRYSLNNRRFHVTYGTKHKGWKYYKISLEKCCCY